MKVLKKVMAILAVLIIIALYAAVVFCAVFIKQVGNKVFLAVVATAVLVPLMLYLMVWLYKVFAPKQPLEEDSWEAKTKKGFQEAAVFNSSKQSGNIISETHNSKQASDGEIMHENKKEDDV